jgi:heat shock protein HslJ
LFYAQNYFNVQVLYRFSKDILMNIKKLVVTALIAGSLAACAHTSDRKVNMRAASVQQLGAYNWQLVEATDRHGRPLANFAANSALKLNFAGQRLNVSGGCNSIGSAYQLSGQDMYIQAPMSTMMACAPDVMAQDAAVIAFMNGQKLHAGLLNVEDAQNPQPLLRIENQRGQSLLWRGVPTATSQYGQPTVVFWEISPQTQTCQTDNGAVQCLKVREIFYNDQGVKVKTGVWRNFAGTIDGWQFNPAESQVLRLNVYEVKPAGAADDTAASQYIYKLDQIIERSEVNSTKHKHK